MSFSLRFGHIDDAALITDFVLEAGGGLFEFLLDGILPGVRARQLIRISVSEDDSALSYSNAVLAFHDDHCVGLALGYDSVEFGIPPILKSIVPSRRYKALAPVLSQRLEPSWYINTLVVNEEARGLGVGRALLDFSANLAEELGFEVLTLHVWADNYVALKLYESVGFQSQSLLAVETQKDLDHSGGMLLMRAPLPLKV